ncbi:MAG TPA: hypothetical protein VFV28_06690 [Limnobacter sp.]|nr:hypothetical protein [Limnobacter sp.]
MDIISDVNFWREFITVGAFALFTGITTWAYSKKRKPEFAAISQQVVQDNDTTGFEERLR